MRARSVVIVEDSDEDFEMIKVLLSDLGFQGSLIRFDDGMAAVEYFRSMPTDRCQLLLLDLNLPEMDGRDVLSQLKGDVSTKSIPVVVFSTSNNPKDVESCYQAGANAFVNKPVDLMKLKALMSSLLSFWVDFNILPESTC